jgi:hypothetical protein
MRDMRELPPNIQIPASSINVFSGSRRTAEISPGRRLAG